MFGGSETEIALARRLDECESVKRHNSADHVEGYALAHSFADVEGFCRMLLNKQLPRLLSQNLTCEQVEDALFEIGETYRGLMAQIRGPLFYRYLPTETEME
jgi:hypothetical protein